MTDVYWIVLIVIGIVVLSFSIGSRRRTPSFAFFIALQMCLVIFLAGLLFLSWSKCGEKVATIRTYVIKEANPEGQRVQFIVEDKEIVNTVKLFGFVNADRCYAKKLIFDNTFYKLNCILCAKHKYELDCLEGMKE